MAGQKDASVQQWESRIKGNPRSLVFSRLADSYRKRGDIDQAIDVCSAGLENHPTSLTGRIILGRCFLEQEKVKEALEEFIKVVEADHRNQIALKMLADIYARQGMNEKAGNLYSFLRAMDPHNDSIITLCAHFKGSGRTNIYEILGISSGKEVSGTATSAAAQLQGEALGFAGPKMADSAGAEGPHSVDSGPFAQTMQFDVEELRAAPSSDPALVDELVSEGEQNGPDTVTGDDISSRMSTMFEEEAESLSEKTEIALTPVESADEPALAKENGDFSFETAGGIAAAEEISGSDISSRIEQLFGEAPPQGPPTETHDYDPVLGSVFQEDMRSSEIASDAAAEIPAVLMPPEDSGDIRGPEETDVSGDDIVSRMSQLFEGSTEQGRSADDEKEAIDDLSEEIGSSLDDAPGQEASFIEAVSEAQPVFPIEGDDAGVDRISGDEVAARLETIFEDDGMEVGPSVSSLTLSEDPAFQQESELTVSSEELSDEIAPEYQPAVQNPSPLSEGPYADTLTTEENSEMSGDDVVARLTEIFPDNLLPKESLEMVDSNSDETGEAGDGNDGFYTMSGGNAQTAGSEETLLEKLDDVEIEVPATGSSTEAPDIFADPEVVPSDEHHIETAEGPIGESGGPSPVKDDKECSIPDHVLTPTLADIYFQQGQSRLAVQIYTRLLQRDPDNEKIARRLQDIQSIIAEGLAPMPPEEGASSGATTLPKPKMPQAGRARSSKAKTSGKPLAGVRIKKNMKKKRT